MAHPDRVGLLFVSSVNPSASVVVTSCLSVHLDFISSPSSHFVRAKIEHNKDRTVLASMVKAQVGQIAGLLH